jgi:mycofactocin system glycosyltransferase
MGIVLDRDTRVLDDGRLLLGGARGRAVTLTAGGATALRGVLADRPATAAQRRLARRLVDAGLAHPVPRFVPDAVTDRVTVVVPVRDRVDELARCLDALADVPVVVVDDGSAPGDARRIGVVGAARGVQVVRHPRNRGPSAARTTGLAQVTTPWVAFVDSDVEVQPGWLAPLAAHLADPAVGLVAPRVVPTFPTRRGTLLARYGERRAPLDLGAHPADVAPYGRVAYLPSAALLARRDALADLGHTFDADLRCGEDVDLVWRLRDAGWTVRYAPEAQVLHHEPPTWRGLLRRRWFYGTSVAGLAARHPDRVAHLRASPVAYGVLAAVLAGRPALAAGVAGVTVPRVVPRLRRLGAPGGAAVAVIGRSVLAAVAGLARMTTALAWPALAALAVGSRRSRAGVLAAVVGPPLLEWWERRPAGIGPVAWTAASLVDDLAYGAGVVGASVRHRTAAAVRPRLARGGGAARSGEPWAAPRWGRSPRGIRS